MEILLFYFAAPQPTRTGHDTTSYFSPIQYNNKSLTIPTHYGMFVKLKDRTDQMIFIFYFQFKTFSFFQSGRKIRYSLSHTQQRRKIKTQRLQTEIKSVIFLSKRKKIHPFNLSLQSTHANTSILPLSLCQSVKVSKRQMNPSENAFLAPKYGFMDSEGLLGRFAKYTLTPDPLIRHPNSTKTDSRDIIRKQYQETYHTFSHLSIGRFRQQTRGE